MSRVVKIQEDVVIYAALLGLGIGILLDILFLKDIRARFYDISSKVLIPLYLIWSAIALAFSMGMPFGNLLLGTLAGLYYGRRLYYQGSVERDIKNSTRTISVFTASVTGIESFFIGLLGLREKIAAEFIQSQLGLDASDLFGPMGIALVVGIVIIIASIQYTCTHIAIATAHKIGKG